MYYSNTAWLFDDKEAHPNDDADGLSYGIKAPAAPTATRRRRQFVVLAPYHWK
jgi:hypothetical protein